MAIYVTERQVQPLVDKVDELVEQVKSGGGSGASAFVIDLTSVEFELDESEENYAANITSIVESEVLLEAVKTGALIKFEHLLLEGWITEVNDYFITFTYSDNETYTGIPSSNSLCELVIDVYMNEVWFYISNMIN